MTELEDDNV